jgi:chromosome segregation ATPase
MKQPGITRHLKLEEPAAVEDFKAPETTAEGGGGSTLRQQIVELADQLRREREAHAKLLETNRKVEADWQAGFDDATSNQAGTIRELQAQAAQMQTTLTEVARQRDLHACNAVEMMRQRDGLSKENRELLGLDKEIEDEVAQLQTTISQLREEMDQAIRFKRADDAERQALTTIIYDPASGTVEYERNPALATCPAPEAQKEKTDGSD